MSTSVRVCIKKSSSEKRVGWWGDNNLSSPHLQLAHRGFEKGDEGILCKHAKSNFHLKCDIKAKGNLGASLMWLHT